MDITDLIGVPFVEFGRDVKNGLDCYGLAIEVEKRLGKKLNDIVLEKVSEEKTKYIIPQINIKKVDYISEGIILEFYGITDNRLHVAIALNQNEFIHATENQGVRVSSFKSVQNYLRLKAKYEVI